MILFISFDCTSEDVSSDVRLDNRDADVVISAPEVEAGGDACLGTIPLPKILERIAGCLLQHVVIMIPAT